MRVKKSKGVQLGERLKRLELESKRFAEMANNLNAWAMETIRAQGQRDELLDKVATITVLLVKEALGRELTEEETAALTEALDGKKGETDGETSQPAEGTASRPVGADVHAGE